MEVEDIDHRSPPDAETCKVSIIVPVFDESAAIAQLSQRLLPVVDTLSERGEVELLFVDDGSVDNTHDLLADAFKAEQKVAVHILRHGQNRGLGAAIATGFGNATGDIVCVMDSDCTYDPEELPGLIDRLIECGADIVTASPYHPDGEVVGCPGWRIALSKLASQMYRAVSPVRLHCYTSIFRAHRQKWASRELIRSAGFVAVPEHLLAAAHAGARIVEYPAVLRSRQYGVSKMRTLSVALNHLRLIASYLFLPKSRSVVVRSCSTGCEESSAGDQLNEFGSSMQTIDPTDSPADAGIK